MGVIAFIITAGVVLAVVASASRLRSEFDLMRSRVDESRRQLLESRRFMNEFTRMLGKVEEIGHAVELVAKHLNTIVGSESFAIFIVDEDAPPDAPRLRGFAVCGVFPTFHHVSDIVLTRARHRREHIRHEFINFGEGVIGEVAATGKPILIHHVSGYERASELPGDVATLMAVPMRVEGKLLGVICAVNTRVEGRNFTDEDLRLFETISTQAALACNQVLIYSERSMQQRVAQELEFGRELQQSLLPSDVPEWGDYRFASFSRPASEVGGDFFDFIEIDAARLMIVVGDATGKGVPACMLMAMCRSFVRCLAERFEGMEKFLYELNRRMYADTDAFHFVTLAVLVIDKETGVCEYGNAGHTPLLMLSSRSARPLSVKPEGQAAGMLPEDCGVEFQTLSFRFEPGMQVMLFSDGINEALNANVEEFGMERLLDAWSACSGSATDSCKQIMTRVEQYTGDTVQSDDQTMLIISMASADGDESEQSHADGGAEPENAADDE